DKDRGIVPHIAIEQRPFDAVRHRSDQTRKFGRYAFRHVMYDRVPRQIDILREAAPQIRSLLSRRITVADCLGIGTPIGVLTMPVLARMAPLALSTADIVLDEDKIAFFEPFALRKVPSRLGNSANILMPHDNRGIRWRMFVQLHVGSADTSNLHLHERGVCR